jgi:hypothetical protein
MPINLEGDILAGGSAGFVAGLMSVAVALYTRWKADQRLDDFEKRIGETKMDLAKNYLTKEEVVTAIRDIRNETRTHNQEVTQELKNMACNITAIQIAVGAQRKPNE